jgi:hypothetical protein
MTDFAEHHPTTALDSPETNQPDTVTTPEGDNEYAPNQPLSPYLPAPERPRGDEPHSKLPFKDVL